MSSVNVEGQPQHSWFQVPHQTLPRDPPMHVQEHNQPGTLGGPPTRALWHPALSLVWSQSSQVAPTLAAFGALVGVLEAAGALDPLRTSEHLTEHSSLSNVIHPNTLP